MYVCAVYIYEWCVYSSSQGLSSSVPDVYTSESDHSSVAKSSLVCTHKHTVTQVSYFSSVVLK